MKKEKRNKCGRDSILKSKIVHRNNNKNVTDVSDEDACIHDREKNLTMNRTYTGNSMKT